MALIIKDRVQETSNTTGTGTLTLNGAVTGFQSFASAIGNGNTTYYGIYANGLLVESCSQRYLKELSNMDLIE